MQKRAFFSTKTYTHAEGLSCCFRQWRASSHCSFLHGYAIQVSLEFQSEQLNYNNWVIDFGGLKEIKAWLHEEFDHKTIVALDDPQLQVFRLLETAGICQLKTIPHTGCEGFAQYIFKHVNNKLFNSYEEPWNTARDCGVRLAMVEVREHGGNSAGVYTWEEDDEPDAKSKKDKDKKGK